MSTPKITFVFDAEHEADLNPDLGRSMTLRREKFQLWRVICQTNQHKPNKAWPWPVYWYAIFIDREDRSGWGFYIGTPTMKAMKGDISGSLTEPEDGEAVFEWLDDEQHKRIYVLRAFQYQKGAMQLAESHPTTNLEGNDKGHEDPKHEGPENKMEGPA